MKVLVVEDEAQLADAVRRGLEGEGIAVDVMRDGVDGLWAATENAYDAIVLDLMLPGLSGRDVLVGLRERGVWTPVLVLTAREGDEVQVGVFDRGADDFLAKPFSFDVLLARLRALVRRGAPERPVVLSVGDLRLEPARRRVDARWRRDRADAARVRRPGAADAPRRRRRDQARDPRQRLGLGVRRGPERRRGLHQLPAPQGRRTVRAALDRRRSGGWATGSSTTRAEASGSRRRTTAPPRSDSPTAHAAAVRPDDAAHDRQPEPRAARRPRPALVEPHEPVEDELAVGRRRCPRRRRRPRSRRPPRRRERTSRTRCCACRDGVVGQVLHRADSSSALPRTRDRRR